MGYDFDFHYKPGLDNRAANALSCQESFPSLAALVAPYSLLLGDLDAQVMGDEKLKAMVDTLKQGGVGPAGYRLVQGRLLYHNRLVVPCSSQLVGTILTELHDSVMGSHSGYLKTLKRVEVCFYWPGMKRDILQYVA